MVALNYTYFSQSYLYLYSVKKNLLASSHLKHCGYEKPQMPSESHKLKFQLASSSENVASQAMGRARHQGIESENTKEADKVSFTMRKEKHH